MHQPKSTFEIEGRQYEIRRISAVDGSWLIGLVNSTRNKAMAAAAQAFEALPQAMRERISSEGGDQPPDRSVEWRVEVAVQNMLDNLDQDTMRKVQTLCLGLVSEVEIHDGNAHLVPALGPTGEPAGELQYDILTVMALTAQTLIFNLTPFFQAGGLVKVFKTLGSSR